MRTIPDAVLTNLRASVNDCSVVAGWLGLRGGRNRRWFCPSCQTEKSSDPDLSTPARGGFACHKCGAKGTAFDLVALAHKTSTRGRDYIDIVRWLASRAGMGDITEGQGREAPHSLYLTDDFIDGLYDSSETPIPPAVSSPPVNEGPRLSSDDAAAIWAECKTRRHPHALAWLEGRGIPKDVIRSGVALLDKEFTRALSRRTTLGFWLNKHADKAIVTPLRSATTGKIGALHVRAFNPSDDGDKRRTCGQKSDDDGAPRGYGLAGDVRKAQAIMLVEGMADTFAAEALLYKYRDVVVVGVDSRNAFPAWAQWLNTHNTSARIVIVRHIDGGSAEEHKEEAKYVRVARETLGAHASFLSWAALANAIDARGLESIRSNAESGGGFDLTDTVRIVTDNGKAHYSRFDALAAVFADVAGFSAATPSARPNNMAAPYVGDVDENIADLWGNE